jgi:hypothetical protein
MPKPEYVKLSVFNQLGQEVATLAEGIIEEGLHKAEFDGNNLPPGIYFYRLQTGNFTETRKLILVK